MQAAAMPWLIDQLILLHQQREQCILPQVSDERRTRVRFCNHPTENIVYSTNITAHSQR